MNNRLEELCKAAIDAKNEINTTSFDCMVEFARYKRLLDFVLQEISDMAKKHIPTFQNAQTARDNQAKAIEEARLLLKQQGVEYPIFDPNIPTEENYGRLLAYAEQESAMVVQLMRGNIKPRPLVMDNVAPKQYLAYSDK